MWLCRLAPPILAPKRDDDYDDDDDGDLWWQEIDQYDNIQCAVLTVRHAGTVIKWR